MLRSITHCLLLFGLSAVGFAEELPLRFDLTDGGPNTPNIPQIKPWKSVAIDPDYGGDWCVTGDLDGDGIPEVVSAKNKWNDGIQYTTSAVAHRLDGSILWKWGNPDEGHAYNGYDVALQIYDWDGNGTNEVILSTEGELVELDGATGKEKRRFPIPKNATDCLVFVNLTGGPRAKEVIVKDRYRRIWAYDYDGKELWGGEWKPGGIPPPTSRDRSTWMATARMKSWPVTPCSITTGLCGGPIARR